jgi:anti-sigma factor RsiW
MNCEETRAGLDQLRSGRLSGEASRRLRRHLASCPACWSGLGDSDRIEALSSMDEPIEPSPDLSERFTQRLLQHRSAQEGQVRMGWWRQLWRPRRLAAAAALAGLLALLVFLKDFRRSPPSSQEVADYSFAEDLPLLEEMDVIRNFELIEDFDAIQKLAEFLAAPPAVR